MTADDVRRLIAYLEERVGLSGPDSRTVTFEVPGENVLLDGGLHPDAVRQILAAPWLQEMVTDVRETPEFCDPSDSPEQVLRYARDVVGEYVRKRFRL